MDAMLVVVAFIVGTVISSFILYLVVKAAVRDGIVEARGMSNDENDQDTISKIICPSCDREHEMDYPKCPYCGHNNFK